MSSATGRFTETQMTQVMHQVAAQLGVPGTPSRLLRLTNNAVFALPQAGLVIRITRSHSLHDRVRKVVRLGARGSRPFKHPPSDSLPTCRNPSPWTACSPRSGATCHRAPPAPDVNDLGAVLRRFHALPSGLDARPLPDLPRWDPVGDARSRLDDAEGLGDTERAALLQWCDDLQPRLHGLLDRAGSGLVHGDAHLGNLLRTPDGAVALCDFDATCWGPWQVDLVAVAVGEIRFRRPGAHRALAAAYGYDVTRDPDWPLLREARELKMVAAAVPLLASAPGVAAEFRIRLTSAVNGDDDARWTPFADLRPGAASFT